MPAARRIPQDLGVLALKKAIAAARERAALAEQADAHFQEALELAELLQERDLAAWLIRYRGLTEGLQGRMAAGQELIALSRDRFEHFRESNQALCDYLSVHLGRYVTLSYWSCSAACSRPNA